MGSITKYNLRSFWKKVNRRKRSFKRFLTGLEKNTPRGLDRLTALTEKEVWSEVDCRSCANCCKTMTPVYSPGDIKRIAAYLGMTTTALKKKWLRNERNTGEWLNKTIPCQFLSLATNECTIYEVRPADCSGFPHLSKRKMTDYMHVHKQNIDSCPATFKLVEKMMNKLL